MLGAIIGDICGSLYEFNNCKDYDAVELFKEGCHFTDDTVMTVAIAHALMDIKEETTELHLTDAVTERMQQYGRAYPHAGYGGLFEQWIWSDKPRPYNNYGNGSAMRVSPVGWLYESLSTTMRVAKQTAYITHSHPDGLRGAETIAGSIYLLSEGCLKDEVEEFAIDQGYHLDFSIDELRPEYTFDVTCKGSVPQAIKCFLESTDFEDCIKLSISLGGDSDTIAAMSCALAEAHYGIPKWMLPKVFSLLPQEMLEQYSRFKELAFDRHERSMVL